MGFSSSWPFWKYIETSTQDTFQTQIFHCLCIWLVLSCVGLLPGLIFWGNGLIYSLEAVNWLIHAELPKGFIKKLIDIILYSIKKVSAYY